MTRRLFKTKIDSAYKWLAELETMKDIPLLEVNGKP
jgi:hypothetical protein